MKVKNGYIGGMNQDLSKTSQRDKVYYSLVDGRVITSGGLSTSSIENVKGTSEVIDLSSQTLETVTNIGDLKIIGHANVRDSVVLFTTQTDAGDATEDGQIFKIDFDKTKKPGDVGYATATLLYEDSALGFSSEYPIDALGRYESSNLRRVYWVDYNNILRSINIDDTDVVDHASPSDPLHVTPDYFDQVRDSFLSEVILNEVTSGGRIPVGSIQYVFRYLMNSGSVTAFSAPSAMISISDGDDAASSSEDVAGNNSGYAAGKAVSISIPSVNNNFDKLELVALFYNNILQSPEIRIVKIIEIAGASSADIVDTGDSLGSYDLSYVLNENLLFAAKTIETKNDYLYAANIKEEFFDVDYDSRAYRFKPNVSTVDLYNSDGTSNTYTTLSNVPDTHDCINSLNDLDNDNAWLSSTVNDIGLTIPIKPAYQRGSYRLGGTGDNVSYNFFVKSMILDDNTDNSANGDLHASQDTVNDTANFDTFYPYKNQSFTNNASASVSGALRGYMRDEIYRFAIVFRNKKGQKSYPKWIADIRFPMISDIDNVTVYTNMQSPTGSGAAVDGYDYSTAYSNTDGKIYMNCLGVRFDIGNVPLNDDGSGMEYEIVRMDRSSNDRTILGQGYINDCFIDDATSTIPHGYWSLFFNDERYRPNGRGRINHALSEITAGRLYGFNSPEVSFNRNLTHSGGDKLKYVGNLLVEPTYHCSYDNYESWKTSYAGVYSVKHKTVYPVDNYSSQYKECSLADGSLVAPTNVLTDVNTIDGLPYNNYSLLNTVAGTLFIGTRGTNYVFAPSSTIIASDQTKESLMLMNYVRPNVSQYGGSTYTDRTNNVYTVSCRRGNGNNSQFIVFGGDTFVTYFDYLHAYYDITDITADPIKNAIGATNIRLNTFFPVESTINCELRTDKPYSRGGAYEASQGQIQETGNDDGDLYLYNSAYSRSSNSFLYISEKEGERNITDIDTKIVVSDNKTNGELVDSWLNFSNIITLQVDSSYGAISELKHSNGRLFFKQENAIGLLSVEERQLLKTSSGNSISTASGGRLDRYDYVTTETGSIFDFIETPKGLYWFDSNKIKMYRVDNLNSAVSDMKGMSSYFENSDAVPNSSSPYSDGPTSIVGAYDSINNDVILSFNKTTASSYDYFTIAFNELTEVFSHFYSYQPVMYIETSDHLFSVPAVTSSTTGIRNKIYSHNSGDYGLFYNNGYSDTVLVTIVNGNIENIKIYNNLEFLSEITQGGDDQYNDTVSSIRVENDYQDTGSIAVVPNSNIKRRMRIWHYTIPRAIANNLTDVSDARIRDFYAKVTISYTNNGNKRLVLHDINTSITPSNY